MADLVDRQDKADRGLVHARRLIERVHAGLERAHRQGKALGRPRTSIVLLRAAADLVEAGMPVAAAARAKGVSRASLYRYLSGNPLAATPGKPPALAG